MKNEILLIDDEKDIRFAVHEILKENNFFVREADTVEKALFEIKKKLPDLVILDVLLDEKNRDGIDILKFIKSIDTDVPVIMISGHANIKIAVDSIKLGAFEFLEKPFNKDRLLNFVNRALETSSLKKENKSLKKNLYSSNELIGNSSTKLLLFDSHSNMSSWDLTESSIVGSTFIPLRQDSIHSWVNICNDGVSILWVSGDKYSAP